MQSVWIALGLFFTLWWTWIGFAVLYNRQGGDEPAQRLLFLIGSVPAGVAAVAIEPASAGDITAFALSLALIRLVLAGAHVLLHGALTDLLRQRIARSYVISAALFLISIAVPGPFRYVLWAIAIGWSPTRRWPRTARRRTGCAATATSPRSSPPTPRRRSTRTTSPSASACS